MHTEQNKSILQNTGVMVLTALFCNLLWGSAFPGIKTGYRFFHIASEDMASQILFAGTRFTLAGVLTVIFGSLIAKKALLPKKSSWKHILVLSLFQTVLQYFFFYVALAHTTGVKASVVEATNVFMAIVFSALFLKERKGIARKLFWCIPGFLGVLLVNLNGQSLQFEWAWNGEGFILLSTIAASMSTVLLRQFSKEDSPVLLSGWQFIIGGIIMILAGLVTGGKLNGGNPMGWLMILYLAFVSAAAYSLWGLLLKYHPVSKVAVFSFSNPVFGVLLSALFLKESLASLGWILPVALVLVSIGIYMVNREPHKN
jgi:drug/metabolite transporter (DMT)-like permease